MTKKEAMRILNINAKALNKNITTRKIKIDITGQLVEDSVYEYLKELEERRKVPKAEWIDYGSY